MPGAHRYTVDDQQFKEAYSKVMALPELVMLGRDSKDKDRYTTVTMLATEKTLIEDAVQLSKRSHHPIDTNIQHKVAKDYNLSVGQKEAFRYLVGDSDMRNLIGIAGSGKSYLLGAVREAHEAQGYRVIGMAMAGKAAENLEQSSGIAARTVASHIASWDKGHEQLSKKDVVVIDEAGMLGSVQYARLLHEAKKHGAKVITAFDSEQLQAISAGAAARASAEYTGFVSLREVRRQQVDWQRSATALLSQGQTAEGIRYYDACGSVHKQATHDASIKAMLSNWQEIRSSQPDKEQLMLAYTRREVKQLNYAARDILKADDALANPHTVTTSNGQREFCEGDRIYFLRNEYQTMDVKNGSLGTIEAMKENSMVVRLDADAKDKEGRLVKVDLKTYNHLDHGYATTIHKSQGSSVDYSHVLASRNFDRHLTYVAMTRHKASAILYWNNEDFKDMSQLVNRLSRERAKDFTLDYLKPQQDMDKAVSQSITQDQADQSAKVPSQSMEDRLQQAQQRLERRAFTNEMTSEGQRIGLQLSDQIKEGERGVYLGIIKLNKQKYAVMQTDNEQGKVMRYDQMQQKPKVKGDMEIVAVKDCTNRELLVGQGIHKERTLHKSKDRGMELELDRGGF